MSIMPSPYDIVFRGAKPEKKPRSGIVYGREREDKAAITAGRIVGRSTTAQHDLLARLGVSREKSIKLTAYKASKLIGKLLGKDNA